MSYRIGLDVGITSIGWATIILNNEGKAERIGDLGVRIFDAAENPKTGESLASPRRMARSMRRRLRRHKHRIDRVKFILEKKGIIKIEEINKVYSAKNQPDVYQLRYLALNKLLSTDEATRVLIHLAQRRGFKSNRKAIDSNGKNDEGKLLAAVNANKSYMLEKGYRTIGEMLYLDPKYIVKNGYESGNIVRRKTRNKADEYINTFSREQILDEIHTIFNQQREFGNTWMDYDFEKEYVEIIKSQRNFDEGPGGNSPYGGNLIERMIGKCTFETDEPRAMKATYTYERFMLLGKLASLRIRNEDGQFIPLNQSQRELLIAEAYKVKDLKYSNIRKLLHLDENATFKGLIYGYKDKKDKVESASFVKLNAWYRIKDSLKQVKKDGQDYFSTLTPDDLDFLGYTLSVYKTDERIREKLTAANYPADVIEALLSLSFDKTGHLSIKAMKKIIPYMENGMDYDKACEAAGYDFKAHNNQVKGTKLPPITSSNITNPVVKRALSQSVKLINAIVRQYGSPVGVNIELAREMSRGFRERREDQKSMENNQALNEKLRQELIETIGILNPKGDDIVRYRLFKEQDGWCFYSGTKLDLTRVFFDHGYADIDHIIPYSISFDDSYRNKVLVLGSENKQKGNRIPMEYLADNKEKLEKFIALVSGCNNISYLKKTNLLKKKLSPEETEGFKERNLNDTRYITRVLANHIRDNMEFEKNKFTSDKKVKSVNGPVTAYIRKRWGLSKDRNINDLHHALDAVTIACIDDRMIQLITQYHKRKELNMIKNKGYIDYETGEILTSEEYDSKYLVNNSSVFKGFPEPWHYFRKELEARLSENANEEIHSLKLKTYSPGEKIKPVFVSRAPKRKASGQGHLDTFRSPKLMNEGFTITKTPLQKLKLGSDGEIIGYYNPSSDMLLYNALKKRLRLFNNDAKKAFQEPFYKPTSTGENGPLVKKVKIVEKMTLGVSVLNGKAVANNGEMIRIDVFVKNNKYFFVPIYASDTIAEILPDKAVLAAKPYSEWPRMDQSYEFIFSLFPSDLIYIKSKTGIAIDDVYGKKRIIKEGYLYYRKASISTASITVISHDKSFEIPSLGIKTLISFKKCQVDYLGNISFVTKEKRLDFKHIKK
jgi:CRISPR-associated endonuclease Csn1